jgi:peptidoglycan/LPS O-acetylase OafA/YrhL
MSTKQLHLPNLDGLRFTGALMVLVFHLFTLSKEQWGSFSESSIYKSIYFFASKGHHGVGLFFVLSGFLIFYLLFTEQNNHGSIQVKNFLIRRILRIWPLYFLIVLFGFFIFPILPGGIQTDHSLLNYSIFLSNLDEIWNGANDPLNFLTITWSVSIEEQFYLGSFLLMLLFSPLRKAKGWPYLFIGLISASVVFRFLNCENERVMYFHTLSNISDLSLGGLSAWLVINSKLKERLANIPRIYIYVIYVLGILVLIGSSRIFFGELRSIEKLISGSFFCFVVLEQVYAKNSFYKADQFKFFRKGGKLTYAVYMFHCIFIHLTLQWMGVKEHGGNVIQFLFYLTIVLSLTWIFSQLSMRYFEGPILALKKKFR